MYQAADDNLYAPSFKSHSITTAGGHFTRELKYLGEYLGNVRTVAEYLVTQRPELGLVTTVHDP